MYVICFTRTLSEDENTRSVIFEQPKQIASEGHEIDESDEVTFDFIEMSLLEMIETSYFDCFTEKKNNIDLTFNSRTYFSMQQYGQLYLSLVNSNKQAPNKAP